MRKILILFFLAIIFSCNAYATVTLQTIDSSGTTWGPESAKINANFNILGALSLPSPTGQAGKFITNDGTNIFWGSVAQGNVYYIRADGTAANKTLAVGPSSDPTKCMSVAIHNASTFNPGDTIIISTKGGPYKSVLYPPSSGSRGNYIVYQKDPSESGTPVFDGTDVTVNTSFTKSSGYTNLYQNTIVFDADPTQTRIGLWENGARLIYTTSLASCDSTAGSFYVSSNTSSPATIYVHSSDSSSVTTNGKLYEYTHRRWCINDFIANTQYISFNNIITTRTSDQYGSIALAPNQIVNNCQANEGNYHNMLVGSGSSVNNCSATNAYYEGGSGVFYVVYEANPSVQQDTVFNNCTATMLYRPDATAGLFTGFYSHTTTGTLGNIRYNNCQAIGTDEGFSADNAAGMYLNGCTDSGIVESGGDRGVIVSVPIAQITRHTSTRANTSSAFILVSTNNAKVTVSGSIAVFNNNFGANFVSVTGTGNTINAYNNDTDGGVGNFITTTGTGTIINSYNNNQYVVYRYYNVLSDTIINSDYNNYVPTIQQFRINGTDYSLAAYQSLTSQDAHSISLSPLYVGAPNYSLRSGSPCINAGTWEGTIFNYVNSLFGNPPDIGAY